ncbi:MAG: translation initiation factor IF-2 [bacterium]
MSEKVVNIPKIISVGELAKRLEVTAASVVAELMKNGIMATINENIDFETAAIIAEYMDITVVEEAPKKSASANNSPSCDSEENSAKNEKRSPIVAVLGHVDHGKTSLLDAIRKTDVVSGEAGGITQHIGAYQVTRDDTRITFLDTPGHSAFEEMRAHGAQITDIALIIVAADDGLKEQTLEAISHAQKAETPMIIVINKIDKPGADINRIYQQLAEINLVPEAWGGKMVCVPVSAKNGEGIDTLLEMVILTTEMLDLKANFSSLASGVVVESHMDKGKGPVATILILNGTLRAGDCLQIGETYGKVRSMEDYKSRKQKEATPGMPVKISGIKDVAQVSEPFTVFCDEKEAREAAVFFRSARGAKKYANVKKINLESITESISMSDLKELSIVIKTDVQGSLDAIETALEKFSTAGVKAKVVSGGVGEVNESDVMMASTASKLIIAFNVITPPNVKQFAKNEGVKISSYRVIYELLDDIKQALEDLLPPLVIELTQGKLEVLQVFSVNKKVTIAGGKVVEGKIDKGADVRVIRKGEEVSRIKVLSIHRGKDEVPFCQIGTECGLGLEGKADVEVGDEIIAYSRKEQKQTINVKI